MSTPARVERRIALSAEHAERLAALARARSVDEGAIIAHALDILFALAGVFGDEAGTPPLWAAMSEPSLRGVWDNDDDAVYDDWRTLHGVSPR